jgi:hypothetical protein
MNPKITASIIAKSVIRTMMVVVQAKVEAVRHSIEKVGERIRPHLRSSPKDSGTEMTCIELSTLPETSSVLVGLNRTTVGGNSCALRIVSNGCDKIVP